MAKDKYKAQFAHTVAQAFAQTYPAVHEQTGNQQVFNADFIYDNLEKPKDPKMGRFALPVFRYGKLLGDNPPSIANKVAGASQGNGAKGDLVRIEAAGGFLNARVDESTLARETINDILSDGNRYGDADIGEGKTELVEYSSVNIAKPFGIGHLRTTILGNSLKKIFAKLGFDAVGMNYLGDWGTQFGKMIVAYRLWGQELDLSENAVEKLVRLYVRFHKEAETAETLNDQARRAFKDLEDGEAEAVALWQQFKDLSIAEFMRVYKRLGIEFDLITGEAALNDKMEAMIERLRRAGLVSESQGALIVDLQDPQLPPLLLKKADGATLYSTRDLTGAFWRWEKWRFNECLYVVATQQADHFKQVFRVVAMLEEAEGVPPAERFAQRLNHVDFGWVRFGDEKLSTRAGNIVFLEDRKSVV